MAILVAVAIPTVASITNTAQDAVDQTNCRTIESMIKLAEAEAANTADTDGAASLSAQEIYAALNEAKLGIENDTFYYNNDTGACDVENSFDASDEVITIVFTNGVAAAPTT